MGLLRHLLYVSRSVDGIAESDVNAIVAASVDKNANHGITGKLLFSGDHFAQVLEGGEASLNRLMCSIEADARHHGVRVLLCDELSHRAFGDWSMAYVHDLGTCDLIDELLAAPLVSPQRATRLIGYLFQRNP
jgi:hypothetical protein